MIHRNWRNAEHYAFTDALSSGQWAWEFLRRNGEYRKDWLWFSTTWQSLEERYGKAPDRDYQSWKKDPDAYKVVDDASGECRVDQDKVLIECWMGAKWGFYKFPLDPATDQPEIGKQLSWREQNESVKQVKPEDLAYLGHCAGHVALGFDLDMPLREQLERAKRFLQLRQARLRREGGLVMTTVRTLKDDWCLMLRILDGLSTGETLESISSELREPSSETTRQNHVPVLAGQAEKLVNGGYLEILKIPR